AMSWAREADKLAFTYHDDGNFTIWSVVNPRQLKKAPFRPAPVVAAAANTDSTDAIRRAAATSNIEAIARALSDSIATARLQRQAAAGPPRRQSVYLGPQGARSSAIMPAGEVQTVSVAALLDSATLSLPDTVGFRREPYKGSLRPEYVARPQVGYAQDNFGRGVYGGTTIVLADMVGNKRLALAGGINGRISEAQVYAEYLNLGGHFQYSLGLQQQPYFFLAGAFQTGGGSFVTQTQVLARYISRSVFASGIYPLNRFTRFEYGASFNNIDRALMFISQGIDFNQGLATGFYIDSIVGAGSLNYAAPFLAYVKDNALFGSTGGIYGRRVRLEVSKIAGNVNWMNYTLDYRRYDALLFNFLTLATRVATNASVGPSEEQFPKYIGRPDFIRGYDREYYAGNSCGTSSSDPTACGAAQLLGSRVAFANVELRFPLVRRFDLGVLPISLPPVDGLFFYDFGMAWSKGQNVYLTRPDSYDFATQRYPLRSYGFGIRLNLFNIALLRWDYAVPRDGSFRKGYWYWTLGQSF
ncbi:MAG: hypothetical protein OEW77_03095, partial [Gemmatimonadota bacterium]|nr:hypothetical protein [Gemmatimonadota bacterium]